MTTIKLKNGSGAPAGGDLVQGEPALDLTNKRLYTEDSGGNVIEVGTNPGVDVTFADDRKAVFGAGSDLQIYHDGSNSYISDQGTGTLKIQGDSQVRLESTAGERYFVGNNNGATRLYYDDSEKLATTSTGIDVTGSVTADGLTVDGDGSFTGSFEISGASPKIFLNETDTTDVNTRIRNAGGNLQIQTVNDSDASPTTRFNIDHATGDISFYEDTGTTAKLQWSASNERLTIPTLTISDGSITTTAATGDHTVFNSTGADADFRVRTGANTHSLYVQGNTGNVGIGTSSPSQEFHLRQSSGDCNLLIDSANGASQIFFGDDESVNIGNIRYDHASNYMRFSTNSAERMRIDSSGNVKLITANDTAGTSKFLTFGTNSFNRAGIKCTNAATYDGSLEFYTGNASNFAERMRIDSSGNLLVGTTDSDPATSNVNGVAITAGGEVIASLNGAAAQFNRRISDGDVAVFKKGGTTVGSINSWSQSGTSRVGFVNNDNNGLGIYRSNSTSAKIVPLKANALDDGTAVDLGNTNARFKDLYLSNAVHATHINLEDAGGTHRTALDFDASSNLKVSTGASAGSRAITFFTENTEQMRLDSSGNLLVGTTSTTDSAIFSVLSSGTAASFRTTPTTATSLIIFRNGNGLVGSISTSGSATAYNTSSDQRLKENIVDAPSASNDIDAIQVRSFDWKADGSHQKYGMVAQELQSIASDAVYQPEDPEDMMGVDYSKLVPMLVKEIQSLRARVAQLETN